MVAPVRMAPVIAAAANVAPVRAVPFSRMAQLRLAFVCAASIKVALVRVAPFLAAPILGCRCCMSNGGVPVFIFALTGVFVTVAKLMWAPLHNEDWIEKIFNKTVLEEINPL